MGPSPLRASRMVLCFVPIYFNFFLEKNIKGKENYFGITGLEHLLNYELITYEVAFNCYGLKW